MRPLFVSYFAAKADGTQTRGWLVLDVGPLVDAAAVQALHRQLEEQLGHEPGMLSVVGFQRLEAP